jgi:hypothetical protein
MGAGEKKMMMRSVVLSGVLGVLVAGPALAQDTSADPNYGEFHLSPGFDPDPGMLSLMAGGDIDASTKFEDCKGFISSAPDVRLFWEGSSSSGLTIKISAISNADTTLIVNGPDGSWYCDDDAGEDSNPSVELKPVEGRYEIWVGTYSSGEIKKAVLGISEVSSF